MLRMMIIVIIVDDGDGRVANDGKFVTMKLMVLGIWLIQEI